MWSGDVTQLITEHKMEVGTSCIEPQGNTSITFLAQTDLMLGKITRKSTATLLRAKVNGTKYKPNVLLFFVQLWRCDSTRTMIS
jgi:hypothetical protein